MIIHNGYENLTLYSPVVTMGIFDGVHRGHKSLINSLLFRARETKGEAVVITFSPHPRLVLDQNPSALFFLTTMEEKKALLEKAGVGHLIVIEFNSSFSNITACDFVNDILISRIGTKRLMIGYDHHFGRGGKGDFETVRKCAESGDITVEQVQGLQTEEGAISSSLIRDALLKGKLDDANNWLGYNYSITGNVIKGRQIGRQIGFPTANIKPDDNHKLIPANGVYAVEVQIDGIFFPGMLNIGSNPTVNNDINFRSIEVNILNFDRDIYGKLISVIFRKRIRDEIKFDNIEQLARQMEQDKLSALHFLA